MLTPTVPDSSPLQLRDEAEARLKAGTAPTCVNYAIGVDALNLLYQLSSNPGSAGNALKLLHELQVHQVELDLHGSQQESTEAELTADLARYRELFQCAPMGYFQLARDGTVLEANRAASEWVGIGSDELSGYHLEKLVAPASLLALRGLLKRLATSAGIQQGNLLFLHTDGTTRQLQVVAGHGPDSGTVLLTCYPAGASLPR